MWPVPAAAVISGHNADLKAGSTLSAHSCTALEEGRESEGNTTKNDDSFKEKGEVAAPVRAA